MLLLLDISGTQQYSIVLHYAFCRVLQELTLAEWGFERVHTCIQARKHADTHTYLWSKLQLPVALTTPPQEGSRRHSCALLELSKLTSLVAG